MKIIPVMDLLDGKVVHAVRGEREKYELVESTLTESADPLSIASKFEEFGFGELYVADLNAIQQKSHNLKTIKKLTSQTSLDLMVDAGFQISKDVRPYVERNINKIVLATETLRDFKEIQKTRERYQLPIVGSVDVKGEQIIADSSVIKKPFPELVQNFENKGVSEIIILNLKKVGNSSGPDKDLLKRTLDIVDLPVLVGGGIRNVEDLRHIKDLGASGTLVATALHSGSLNPEDLEEL